MSISFLYDTQMAIVNGENMNLESVEGYNF